MQHENVQVKKGISDLEPDKSPTQRRFDKLLPLALILIPLLVLGIFMLIDEQEKATQTSPVATEELEELEQGQSWEDHLRERWAGRTFGELVREISITQYSESHYYDRIAEINNIRFGGFIEPRTLAYQGSGETTFNVMIFLTQDWSSTLEEILGNWLSVEGAEWERIDSNGNAILLALHKPEAEVTINISGLPQITLIDREPLTYTMGSNLLDAPAYLASYPRFIGKSFDLVAYGLHQRADLIASTAAEYVDLYFSEQMVRAEQIGEQWEHLIGEWISTDAYRIYLNRSLLTHINLHGLYSLEGNQPAQSQRGINLIWKKDSPWINLVTGDRVKLSKQDALYDAIIMSPNGKHAVGLDTTWAEFGPGTFYTLFLDQGNSPPIVIADRFYTTVQHHDYPVIWLNNEEFIYFTYDKVHLYNIQMKNETVLFQTNEEKHIISASFDERTKLLHLYTKDEFHVNQTPNIDYYIYSLPDREIKQAIKPFSAVAEHAAFNSRSYNVLSNLLGLFQSILSETGEHVTVWTKTNGKKEILQGHVLFCFSKGILLQDEKFVEGMPHYKNWWLDSNGRLTELEVIPEAYYNRFGDHLTRSYYNGEQMVMHLFNQNSWTWVELMHHEWGNIPIRGYAHPLIKEIDLEIPIIKEIIDKSK